jgi:hypothetical protein
VELSARSLALDAPDVGAVAEESVDVVDVEELVLWSASMLPVVLVPVAVFASGVVVVVPETAVSFCDVGDDGYELVGSVWPTAAALSRTDEMTTASAFLRM